MNTVSGSLAGYVRVSWRFPTFVTPVFRHEGRLCIQGCDTTGNVFSAKISEEDCEFLPMARGSYDLNRERYFGFAVSPAEVRFGSRADMEEYFRWNRAILRCGSLTQAHIASFLGESEVANEAEVNFASEVIAVAPGLAKTWKNKPALVRSNCTPAVVTESLKRLSPAEPFASPATDVPAHAGQRRDKVREKRARRVPLRVAVGAAVIAALAILWAFRRDVDRGSNNERTPAVVPALPRQPVDQAATAKIPAPPLISIQYYLQGSTKKTKLVDREVVPPSISHFVVEVSTGPSGAALPARFETRVDGIDRNWVPMIGLAENALAAIREGRTSIESKELNRRELFIPRNGTYTVQTRAIAETGAVSDPAIFTFTILPQWWRTTPVMLGIVFALVPLGYGVYRLRLHALAHRNAELEGKVRERTEELEQASASKTQFVANMSHDIRNPLNGIVGLALALEDTRIDARQRELVATLRECTTYLSSLVDDVLDFATIEAGKVELRNAPFALGELLNSVVLTLKADTVERGAAIYVEVDPALPAHVLGDAGRIQQILVNYVSNALKYAGGDIHLSAAVPAGAPNEVEFAVTDHGRGISEDEQATLFTKFTRLAGARESAITGAGLGLAACRLLADIMSGSVGVESRLGHGSRFFLRLPLTAAAPLEVDTGLLPNTTVLLVEDTDYNALAATAVLRRLGLSCERAKTGGEALELFAKKRFNIVLLDRNLPDMDGIEVAQQMRELESDGLHAIILAVTAYCTADDRKMCLDAGMDGFVGKPLTPEKVRRTLLESRVGTAVNQPETISAEAGAREIVDVSLLNYLSDGSPDGFKAQIERYIAALYRINNDLVLARRRKDFEDIAACAHRIVAQARMVSDADLTIGGEKLELAARSHEQTVCDVLGEQVAAEVDRLARALRSTGILWSHNSSSEPPAGDNKVKSGPALDPDPSPIPAPVLAR